MFSRTFLYRNRAAVRDNIHQEGGLSDSRGNRSRNKNLLPYNIITIISLLAIDGQWRMEHDGTREGVLVYHATLVNQGCEARGQSKQGARRDTI